MNARWAVLAGGGAVGAAWVGRTLSASMPPEVVWTLPGPAQAALGIVGAIIIGVLVVSMFVAGAILIFGGDIR